MSDVKVGLYNENFKIDKEEVLEEIIHKVGDKDAKFSIVAGPMTFNGKQLKDTYLLEVRYKDAYKAHKRSMLNECFGSHLYHDFGKEANKIAEEFCKANGYILNQHFNSWPEYQAIVSKQPAS